MKNFILKATNTIFDSLKPESVYKSQISISNRVLSIQDKKINLPSEGNLYLLAMGKASAFEAKAIYDLLTEQNIQLTDALVITKYNHSLENSPLKTIESSHPIVDENSLLAGYESIAFINKIQKEDLLIFCLSGGASALVESFDNGVDFKRIQEINQTLLSSGISIEDFNIIRKSISKIKNGGLFKNLKSPAVSFITCDIPSGNLNSVSSSPSIYTPIDEEYLFGLLAKYLNKDDSKYIRTLVNLEKNTYDKGINVKIADANFLGELTFKHLKKLEEKTEILLPPLDESLETGKEKIYKHLSRTNCSVSLGELNIQVTGNGLGGRSTHFVLSVAYDLFYLNILKLDQEQMKNCFILSVGTDGSDGPTDAAGAYFSYVQFQKQDHKKMEQVLNDFDSYNFFKELGTLIKTGPTGTNLMDLRIVCI